MPRRNGCFQQALAVWFEVNRTRFAVPARINMLKGGRVAITLLGQPACLSITASPHNLGVWVSWQGENWDALLDLDILAVKAPGGLRCALCEGLPVKIWTNPEALWADHLFEGFLSWVNDRYAKSDCLMLHGSKDSFSLAKLSNFKQCDELEKATAVIPIH